MMTVHEVSRLAGVSVRTLQYYDRIGLLSPAEYSGAGYRLYDDSSLERLQQILLFRELEFSLKDIREIMADPGYDRNKALQQQIRLLKLKQEHLQNLIDLAEGIRVRGVKTVSFDAFDTRKIDEYAARAKASWGTTPAYKEYERKSEGRTAGEDKALAVQMMNIFAEFGDVLKEGEEPASEKAQTLVQKLRDFITEHYYTCTREILASLGRAYAGGGEMSANIDQYGGAGTADFAGKAVEVYCSREQMA